jgi:hypothetical protein
MTEVESFRKVYREVPKATGFSIAAIFEESMQPPTIILYVTLSTLGIMYIIYHRRTQHVATNDKVLASCLKYMIPIRVCGNITRQIVIRESIEGYDVTIYTPYALLHSTPPEEINPQYFMQCDDIASILGLVERKLNGD